jgi:hypothetical protein
MSERFLTGTEFNPPKPDKTADKATLLRKEFEEALHEIDPGGFQLALEVLQKYQGAVPFFELGVKLGQEDPKIAQEIIDEIKGKLMAGEQFVGQQIRPNQYPRENK